MRESSWDVLKIIPNELGFNINKSVSDPEPRFSNIEGIIHCRDAFLTSGNWITKRPGVQNISQIMSGKTIEGIWFLETLNRLYAILSARDASTGKYALWYADLNTVPAVPVNLGSLRGLNVSTKPHLVTIYNRRAYVKSFPDSASPEKLGTVIVEESSPGTLTVKTWGVLGPTVPARLVGAITYLTSSLTESATTINVSSTSSFPAAPFKIWIGDEVLNVTSKTANTFTATRGADGTTAQEHDMGTPVLYRDWGASAHRVDVKFGWYYSYCYKTATGQYSNRADIERNPDNLPSFTGPFFDLKPKITVQGHPDTTNVPKIVILRSTDGDGQFRILEEIDNTGAGPINYQDDSLGSGPSGTTYEDPVPDNLLDTFTSAPSMTSNSPPPTVVPPQVIGTDTPSANSYSMTTYASRIWLHVENYVFYSSREELRSGIAEESFPSGNSGNFFTFSEPVSGLRSTNDALYILTVSGVYKLTGTTRDTFNVNKISNIGMVPAADCSTSFEDKVAYISRRQDEIILIDGDKIRGISYPLYSELSTRPVFKTLTHFRDNNGVFIATTASIAGYGQSNVICLFDVQRSTRTGKPFWHIPWQLQASENDIKTISGTDIGASSTGANLFLSVVRLNDSFLGGFDRSFYTDSYINSSGAISSGVSIQSVIVICGISVPPGNHVNFYNQPFRLMNLHGFYVTFSRRVNLSFSGFVAIYPDNSQNRVDLLGTQNTLTSYPDSTATARSVWYPSDKACYSAHLAISATTPSAFDINNILAVYHAEDIR
ncbi:MAG: hypothetical protein V2G41_09655 [bacterium JZ-2024 1]